MDQSALARKNLERRLSPLRELQLTRPTHGWLRAIRQALGMSSKQLATRLGVVPSRITALEKAEAQDAITLKTLREAAEAMDCMLVYAVVPRTDMNDMLRARAQHRAQADLARIHHTMSLENQAPLSADVEAQLDRKITELLSGSLRRLWDDA